MAHAEWYCRRYRCGFAPSCLALPQAGAASTPAAAARPTTARASGARYRAACGATVAPTRLNELFGRPQGGDGRARPGAFSSWRAAAAAPTPTPRQKFNSFDDMLAASPAPALVDFYSNTCGPCVLLGREIDKAAPALRALPCRVFKVDTDRWPAVANRFRVEALPTLIVFKDGAEVKRLTGYRPAEALEREVRAALGM